MEKNVEHCLSPERPQCPHAQVLPYMPIQTFDQQACAQTDACPVCMLGWMTLGCMLGWTTLGCLPWDACPGLDDPEMHALGWTTLGCMPGLHAGLDDHWLSPDRLITIIECANTI